MQTKLSLCALLALAAVASQAQAEVKLTGSIRLTGNLVNDAGNARVYELKDNASRLTFSGSEDLGGGMKALFGLEMGMDVDSGVWTSKDIPYRNAYVGLSGDWGVMAMGRLDSGNPTGSPLYSQLLSVYSQAPNDAGRTGVSGDKSYMNSRNRSSNSVGYRSPSINGFDVRARVYFRDPIEVGDTEQTNRALDVGLNYVQGPLTATLGWGRDMRGGGLADNAFEQKVQVGLRYDFGPVAPYFLVGQDQYHKATTGNRGKLRFGVVGLQYKTGAHKVSANLLFRDAQAKADGTRQRGQLGYQYALSKRTELQAFIDHDRGASKLKGVAVNAKGLGLRHDF